MKLLAGTRHGRLLFRTYLVIVGGLVATAAVLDYGFGRLQDALAPPADTSWARAAVQLIETRLAAAAPDERADAAREIERELGFPVRLLPLDAVVHAGDAPASGTTREMFDDAGRSIFLHDSAALGGAIQMGPIQAAPPQSTWLDVVPHLFYLAIFALVGVLLWPLIRDLNVLTAAARAFAADYRQPMITAAKATTLRELATSFDEMAARIRNLIQGQKDLTSALSHEIRTPLARIKFALAVLGEKAPSPKDLQAIEDDVREIDRLIATMLEFARLDHPETQIEWQLTPADEFVHAAASKCLLREDQSIRANAPKIAVRMDPDRMTLAASNLLVNACRYAQHQVTIELKELPGRYVLAVDDDGPGIPAEARETVFKAFARLDDSRSRGTGGYGLGLAIVARIAALHGGTARAERSPLGGARIVIEWPSRAPAADQNR